MLNTHTLNYKKDYDKGLDTLMDIQQLSDQSMTKVLEQAFFYFSEIKRKADVISINNISKYESLRSTLKNHFNNILIEHFSNKKKYKGFNLVENFQELDLDSWNSLLALLPDVMGVVDLINYHGGVDINLSSSELKFSGFVLENNHLEMNRRLIYSLTRSLMNQEVLLTFKITDSEKKGLKKLEITADYSKFNSLDYCFDISENGNIFKVKLSGIVSKYILSKADFDKIGEHTIYEILSNGDIKKRVLDQETIDYSSKEILHFSFLFRPISIILPMKGSFQNSSAIAHLDDVISMSEQDVFKKSRKINFFSLFNQ